MRLDDGSFTVLDGHVDMEAEARDVHKALLDELGIRPEDETRQARPPTEFEIKPAPRSTRRTTAASPATSSASTETSGS